jgi:hypothetical protein
MRTSQPRQLPTVYHIILTGQQAQLTTHATTIRDGMTPQMCFWHPTSALRDICYHDYGSACEVGHHFL